MRALRPVERRAALVLAVVLAAMAIAMAEPLHSVVRRIVAWAEPVITRHAVAGAVTFVLLSALSAMAAFLSTAALTPVAVKAFGTTNTLLLLWAGWVLGGLASYTIGRVVGRPAVAWLLGARKMIEYERRAKTLATFGHVLLFQLAMPSEVPGYVLGLVGCRFLRFAAAMTLGELPFAIGAVYLGESFLDRNYPLMIGIAIVGVTFSWVILRRAARLWSTRPPNGRAPGNAPTTTQASPAS